MPVSICHSEIFCFNDTIENASKEKILGVAIDKLNF